MLPSHAFPDGLPCQVWSTRDYSLLNELAGHDERVVGANVTPDEKHIVTASHDRTFKLWADPREG
jgi:U4/U6 small nuclear ribonucleoprotein PRP4